MVNILVLVPVFLPCVSMLIWIYWKKLQEVGKWLIVLLMWMEQCRKVIEYGKKIGKALPPIGVRGKDKATLTYLFSEYYSQLNGVINDYNDRFDHCEALPVDIFDGIMKDTVDAKRFLAFVDVLQDVGQFFGKGFTAVDLEQSKYLFVSGDICFFPEGTWNAYSLINNTPFEIGIMRFPPINGAHRHAGYFTGIKTESGIGAGGSKFGITKATKHFDIALEFIQFLTSYEINQLFVSYPKWGPAVKFAKYDKEMEPFAPNFMGNRNVHNPLWLGNNSVRKFKELLEEIIIKEIKNPRKYFITSMLENKDIFRQDVREALNSDRRGLFS